MNNRRRQRIKKLVSGLEVLKSELESITEEENEYYENIPDGLKESDNACRSVEIIDLLESSVGNLEEALEQLEECTDE